MPHVYSYIFYSIFIQHIVHLLALFHFLRLKSSLTIYDQRAFYVFFIFTYARPAKLQLSMLPDKLLSVHKVIFNAILDAPILLCHFDEDVTQCFSVQNYVNVMYNCIKNNYISTT